MILLYSMVLTLVLLCSPRVSAASDDFSAGRKLYTVKCASCHKLYDPSSYDDVQWNSWMVRMRKKARLNEEQYRQLMAYLNSIRGVKGTH